MNVPLAQDAKQTQAQLGCPIQFSRSKKRYDFVGQALNAGQWPNGTK